ncbi:MAG: hypothetical protein JXB14_06585 [Candidatus Altiarchaeota archaeon]|nr:hypothetical protein [Candidatus Altiarchaeota archaeon]
MTRTVYATMSEGEIREVIGRIKKYRGEEGGKYKPAQTGPLGGVDAQQSEMQREAKPVKTGHNLLGLVNEPEEVKESILISALTLGCLPIAFGMMRILAEGAREKKG